MNIVQCPHCKVKHLATVSPCPICKKMAHGTEEEENIFTHDAINKTKWQRVLVAISFLLLVIPSVVVLLVDYINTQSLTWSLIVVVAIGFAWVYLCIMVFFYRVFIILFLSFIINTVAFLFILDFVMQSQWFFSLAFPLIVLWVVTVYLTMIWIKKARKKGVNIIGIIFFLVAFALIGTEATINYEFFNAFVIQWSLISTAALLPASGMVFYFHKHSKRFERWFHI